MTSAYVKSTPNNFRTQLAASIFKSKYALTPDETWLQRCHTIVDDVCGTRGGTTHPLMSKSERQDLVNLMHHFAFLPGGRYIYYAGRGVSFWNNCFLFRGEEDTREEWGRLLHSASDSLMSGGGIGTNYDVFRGRGELLRRTGGVASGPLPLANSINEVGRNVRQGGSRRSAIYGSLNWKHADAGEWLHAKDWSNIVIPGTNITYAQAKAADFDAAAPLDSTNISLNYDNAFLTDLAGVTADSDAGRAIVKSQPRWGKIADSAVLPKTFIDNVRMAKRNGEPGFSFNFFDKEDEVNRNAPVHPDTWVYTSTGYQQVKDIVETPVHLWTGQQYAPTKFTKTRKNDDVVRVTTTGRREIITSRDHEFFLEGGTKVQAANLQAGDTLMQSCPPSIGGRHEPDAYALAFAYGDGWFSQRYPKAEIALVGAKEAVLPKLLGLRCTVSRDKRGILRVYYKKNELFRSRDKATFPKEVYAWDLESRREFLAGELDADGNDYGGFARLSSVHKGFLQGVQRLCDSLGFTSLLNKGSAGTYKGTPTWMLVIKGALSTLPVVRLKLRDQALSTYKVTNIEDAGTSDVYCCDVGVEEHSFYANGVIVSNCCEVTSSDDSDMCNIGSVNMAACGDIDTFKAACELGSKFLICGTIRSELPDERTRLVREKNRRIGLGIMGVHEWLLQRDSSYEMTDDLRQWLKVYAVNGEAAAREHCDRFYISQPVAYRAIAPTGTIGTMAGTTTGIEPIFAVAYKRRYIDGDRNNGKETRKFQYYVDTAAQDLMDRYGTAPEKIETALDLAKNPERRIAFQADVQDHVDMAISSTLNLPAWDTEHNNEDGVDKFARIIAKYAPRLRGLTMYPDGSRGGQPLVSVPLKEATDAGLGVVYEENSDNACKSGVCGI